MLTILTMTIDRLEQLPSQEHVFRIHLSDGSVIRTQDYVIAELGLYCGLELSEALLSRLKEAAGLASAKNRAVRILSASGVSKQELQYRLTKKGESQQDAEAAVEWLSDLELLDDGKTAERLVRSAVAKGYGASRIKQILFEKRIPKEYWEEALAHLPDMDNAIDKFLCQRLRGHEPDKKELKRTVDALVRRGHNWQDIHAGLRRYSVSLDEKLEEQYE